MSHMAFVRAKGPDGSEFTIDERAVKALGATVLKGEPATDRNGVPLPAKKSDKAGHPASSEAKKEA